MAKPENLLEGHYVRVLTPALEGKFFKVGKTEPFTYETGTSDTAEFSSVSSGSESGFKNIDVLEPDESPRHLFWVEWGVKSGGYYQIKIPTGTDRLGTDEDKDVARITNVKSPHYAPGPYGFWLINDYYPAINFVNKWVAADGTEVPTGVAIIPKVWFSGTKWDLEEVKEADIIKKLQNYEKRESPSIPFSEVTISGIKYAE